MSLLGYQTNWGFDQSSLLWIHRQMNGLNRASNVSDDKSYKTFFDKDFRLRHQFIGLCGYHSVSRSAFGRGIGNIKVISKQADFMAYHAGRSGAFGMVLYE